MRRKRTALLLSAALAAAGGAAALYSASGERGGDNDYVTPGGAGLRLAAAAATARHRSTSVALPHGGCRVTPATGPTHHVAPTFTASYPGSGAKMVWNLIEGLTGYVTGDEWTSNGHEVGGAVTVKTHYPHSEGNKKFIDAVKPGASPSDGGKIDRMILILRNPQNAIPSYLNFLYEVENNLDGHSTRAPLQEWFAFRDHEFDNQIRQWREHAEYWLERYPEGQRLILSFEGLTNDVGGPIFTKELAKFLDSKGGGVPVIYGESVPCVWETVVKNRGQQAPPTPAEQQARRRSLEGQNHEKGLGLSDSDPANPQSLRTGKALYPYTEVQLDVMMAAIVELKNKFNDFKLGQILDSYVNTLNGVKASVQASNLERAANKDANNGGK